MKKTTTLSKLSLNPETIRMLATNELSAVVGGTILQTIKCVPINMTSGCIAPSLACNTLYGCVR